MKTRLFTLLAVLSLLAVSMIPVQTAQADSCRWYTVRAGDNLSQIARRYGVSVSAILGANHIANPNRIYSGQNLCIPAGGGYHPPADNCVRIHVVKKNQTLTNISKKYGVTVAALREANGLKKSAVLRKGQKLVIPVKCYHPAPPPKPAPPSPASKPWKGYYWDNQDLSGSAKFIRDEASVNFLWGSGAPAGLPCDHFSVRWTRTMHFEAGNYLFHVKVDDGVRLFVDGEMLINEWHESAPTSYGAEKKMTAGNHVVQIEYFEQNGEAQIQTQIELLDREQGTSGQGLWYGEYWNNEGLSGAPAKTASYHDLYFEWGNKSPMAGIAADYFSSRFVGDFAFAGGSYRFYITVDDGVRLYLDDTLILDQWHLGSRLTHYKDVDISEGTHRIKVEHYEHNGDAVLKVFWSKR